MNRETAEGALPLLCDEQFRVRYAAARRRLRELGEGGFDGTCVSTWADGEDGNPLAVFVDEGQCIGCTHCSHVARNTFFMEDDYGRARVYNQQGDTSSEVMEAIDTCPVNCIHFVSHEDLVVLEKEREGMVINFKERLARSGGGRCAAVQVGARAVNDALELHPSLRAPAGSDWRGPLAVPAGSQDPSLTSDWGP